MCFENRIESMSPTNCEPVLFKRFSFSFSYFRTLIFFIDGPLPRHERRYLTTADSSIIHEMPCTTRYLLFDGHGTNGNITKTTCPFIHIGHWRIPFRVDAGAHHIPHFIIKTAAVCGHLITLLLETIFNDNNTPDVCVSGREQDSERHCIRTNGWI